MITRVLDQNGRVLHDCADIGCEVSWDGYVVATGEPVTNRADPDTAVWTVSGDKAREKTDVSE